MIVHNSGPLKGLAFFIRNKLRAKPRPVITAAGSRRPDHGGQIAVTGSTTGYNFCIGLIDVSVTLKQPLSGK
ncbi:MAG: hypothetical protein WBD31_18315 [Rubripirellula sp.]